MTDLTLPMSTAMQSVTMHVRVTGQRRTRTRLWLGTRLMRFAAWVIGCNVTIDTEAQRGSMAASAAVPTRYDVNAPDYDWNIGRHLRVMLDGVEVSEVTAYDVAAGTITRHAKDLAGHVRIDPVTERLALETITGAVTVEWVDHENRPA